VHGLVRLVIRFFGFDDNTRTTVGVGSGEGIAIAMGVWVGVGGGVTTELTGLGSGDLLGSATNKAITISKYVTAITAIDR